MRSWMASWASGAGARAEEPLAGIIERANRASTRRVAVDIPTGVDADSGAVEGIAFRADLTVTLGYGKRGLWGSPGADYAGDVEIADIGLAPGAAAGTATWLLAADDVRPLLPRRAREWNKGKSGRVLVAAGSADFSGAPVLVANAAYRAGAGLVDLAVPRSIAAAVGPGCVEAVFTPVPSEDAFGPESLEAVTAGAGRAKSVACGPGVGSHDQAVGFVRGLLPRLKDAGVALVLDADGLNTVAGWDEWPSRVPDSTVVTPHPGEMARLLQSSVESVQADRFAAAREAAARFGVTVVLKGSNTIIAAPGQPLRVCPLGSPNLGTAGTGDVLTGIIAAYLAQGLAPLDAATAGVWVHAQAGDELRRELGQVGTVASDLWPLIPRVRAGLLQPLGLD